MIPSIALAGGDKPKAWQLLLGHQEEITEGFVKQSLFSVHLDSG